MCTSRGKCKPAPACCSSPRWRLVLSLRTGFPTILRFLPRFPLSLCPCCVPVRGRGAVVAGTGEQRHVRREFRGRCVLRAQSVPHHRTAAPGKTPCGTLDVRAFYIRRMLRIWPLYFFCIGLALVPALNLVHSFSWRYVAAFLLLAGNWSIVAWGWPIHTIISPLWTVSIEEQFYQLWPPIVGTLSRKRIILAAIAMLILSNLARVLLVAIHAGPNSMRCNTLARLDAIAPGILVAALLRGRMPKLRVVYRLAMLCTGIAALSWLRITGGPTPRNPCNGCRRWQAFRW
jgi:hypothetical protein